MIPEKTASINLRLTRYYCRICDRYRPNEQFTRKGHREHVCKKCSQLPAEKRRVIEQKEEIAGFLAQSNISKKNLTRLKILAKSSDDEISQWATLVLVIGKVHPRKRKRLKYLARERKDLIAQLEKTGLIFVCGSQ